MLFYKKIDELLQESIESFFGQISSSGLIENKTFVKKQDKFREDIHQFFEHIYKLDFNQIDILARNQGRVYVIIDIFKRILIYFLSVYLIIVFPNEKQEYINFCVNFYDFKFLDDNLRSKIVENYDLVKEFYQYFIVKKKPAASERLQMLLNSYTDEVLKVLETSDKDSLLYVIPYTLTSDQISLENKKINNFLEELKNFNEDFIYITVIRRKDDLLSFESLRNALGIRNNNDITKFKELLVKDTYQFRTIETILDPLFKSGIVFPIVEDILLYHDSKFKYETQLKDDPQKYKSDTRVKFITDRIQAATTLYSYKDNKTVKRLFENIMKNRNGVAINYVENLKVIDKNIYTKNFSDLHRELVFYNSFAFLNFRELNKLGITVDLDNNVDALRLTSLTTQDPKDYLEFRMGTNLNIVGMGITANNFDKRCLKYQFVNQYGKEVMSNLNKLLEKSIFQEKTKGSYFYFKDVCRDTTEIEELVDKFYIGLQEVCAKFAMNNISQEDSLFWIEVLLDKLSHLIIKIPENSSIMAKLKYHIYFKILPKLVDRVDKKENELNGVGKYMIKLPQIPAVQKTKRVSIVTDRKMCIHYHILEKINVSDSQDVKSGAFSTRLEEEKVYNLINRYFVRVGDEFKCKSCENVMESNNYAEEGKFSEATGKFIPAYQEYAIKLKDNPRYSNFKSFIDNNNKYIESMAKTFKIVGLSSYGRVDELVDRRNEKQIQSANRIDSITREILEIFRYFAKLNDTVVDPLIKKSNIEFGTAKSLLFVFRLEDHLHEEPIENTMAQLKMKNILSHILFHMLLEIGEKDIRSLRDMRDKHFNLELFLKKKELIFGNMKIIYNASQDSKSILEYEYFCFVLFVLSGLLYKFQVKRRKVTKGESFMDTVHTVVSICNFIQQLNQRSKDYHIERATSLFLMKLNTVYSKEFTKETVHTLAVPAEERLPIFKLLTRYSPYTIPSFITRSPVDYKTYAPRLKDFRNKYYHANNITNCPFSTFHIWRTKGNTMQCIICQSKTNTLEYNESESEKINNKYDYFRYFFEMFLLNTYLETLKEDERSKLGNIQIKLKIENIFQKEFFAKRDKETLEQLLQLSQNINTFYPQSKPLVDKYVANFKKILMDDYKKRMDSHQKSVARRAEKEKIKKDQYKDILQPLDQTVATVANFIRSLEDIVGKDNKIFDTYLQSDSYILDHNFLEQEIEPVRMTQSQIYIRKKHKSLFRDTIIINRGNVELFYDLVSQAYLGYREEGAELIEKNYRNFLKVEYSTYNKLMLLGFENRYKRTANLDLEALLLRRFQRSKQLIDIFIGIMYKIKNNYQYDENYQSQKFEYEFTEKQIVDSYRKLDLKIMTPEGFFVFEDWDLIKEKTKFRNVDYNLEGQEYIDLVKVTHFDTSYLRLLSYFLHEIEKLLVLNEKLYKKAEIINMVVRIINYIFDIHNDNNRKSIKYQINKYILDSSSFKYLFQPDQGFQNDFSATLKLRDVDMEDVKEETYEDMLKELDEKEAADEEMGAIDHDNDSEDDDHGNIEYEL